MTATLKRRKAPRNVPAKVKPRTPIALLLEAARGKRQHKRIHAARAIGCSPSTLTNWEENGLDPTRSYRASVAEYVGVKVADLERLLGRVEQ